MGEGSCRRDPFLWGSGDEIDAQCMKKMGGNELLSLISLHCTLYLGVQKAEQIAASSVPLSGLSSGTDEASLSWSKYCIGESVQGIDLDDGLLMPKLS